MAKKKILKDNGKEILPITHESCVLDNNGVSIGSKIGNINELATDSKTDLVSAINDILQFINNDKQEMNDTKQQIIDLLISSGIEMNGNESWEDIIGKLNGSVGGGGLDVISATELPATGNENQICVITDNPVDQFMLTSNYNDKTTDSNTITLYTSNTASNDITNGTLISITSGNLITNYYFSKACQGDNRLSSYIYQNNNWNLITQAYIALLEKGYYANQSFHGSITSGDYFKYSTAGNGIYSAGTQTRIYATFAKKINFTLYNTIKIKTHIDTTTSPAECYMYTDTTTYNTYGSSKKTSGYKSFSSTTTPTEITFDISKWTGEQYLAFEVNTAGRVFITDLYLY